MMNYIFAGMLVLGLFFAAVNGNVGTFTDGLISSAEEGVYFVIGLCGLMGMWSGFMNIAKETGLLNALAKRVEPCMRYLFPKVRNKEVIASILMSFVANLFGAGNSSTVFSLKSMVLLDEENGRRETASDAMCMFVAMSMSMVQLVPITVLKILSDGGAENPESIIIPSFLAGSLTLVISILLCKYYERRKRRWQ